MAQTSSTRRRRPRVGSMLAFWAAGISIASWAIYSCDGAEPSPPEFDYGEALQKSMWFYKAQRAGSAPAGVSWRGSCFLSDGGDGSYGLPFARGALRGGYFDAGDFEKFALPFGYAFTSLAWGALEFGDGYEITGQLYPLLSELKYAAEFILASWDADTQMLVAHVGNLEHPHDHWMACEVMGTVVPRQIYTVSPSCPGSEVAAEYAAALAAISLVLDKYDSDLGDYPIILRDTAEELYAFAVNNQGTYHTCVPGVESFYKSWSGYQDELTYAAAWLATANIGTRRSTFLQEALTRAYDSGQLDAVYTGTSSWDNKLTNSALLLYDLLLLEENDVDSENCAMFGARNLLAWIDGTVPTTPGGLRIMNAWGSLRYATSASFLAEAWANRLDGNAGLESTVGVTANELRSFSASQVNYALGANPQGRSYVVGFGDNPPLAPHHRQASGVWGDPNADPQQNRHVLYGALVGGPSSASDDSSYLDIRNNYQENEVALDYNALFSGALAALASRLGGSAALESVPVEPAGEEFRVQLNIVASEPSSLSFQVRLEQLTGWPARRMALSARYYADFTDLIEAGLSPSTDVIVSGHDQPTGSSISFLLWESPLFYIQMDWSTGNAPYPGSLDGATKHIAESNVKIALTQEAAAVLPWWNRANDFSQPWAIESLTLHGSGGELLYGEIPPGIPCVSGCYYIAPTPAPSTPAPSTPAPSTPAPSTPAPASTPVQNEETLEPTPPLSAGASVDGDFTPAPTASEGAGVSVGDDVPDNLQNEFDDYKVNLISAGCKEMRYSSIIAGILFFVGCSMIS